VRHPRRKRFFQLSLQVTGQHPDDNVIENFSENLPENLLPNS
jgi:hypothetical protein